MMGRVDGNLLTRAPVGSLSCSYPQTPLRYSSSSSLSAHTSSTGLASTALCSSSFSSHPHVTGRITASSTSAATGLSQGSILPSPPRWPTLLPCRTRRWKNPLYIWERSITLRWLWLVLRWRRQSEGFRYGRSGLASGWNGSGAYSGGGSGECRVWMCTSGCEAQ